VERAGEIVVRALTTHRGDVQVDAFSATDADVLAGYNRANRAKA
jgi:hypothetical protein